ncbi:NAD(P)-dependent dehydrogenase [Yamadazyma tenuis]|uniref:NAD(P)-binding protein n=1 Tax=Candida tenuis (strain ATCC 10573 / BCRC 21748 / CBS 615 / JCM 9827 / NBRC 10315 / NRRL Y-1498 / VKM Y-70) TaxID=590646 RepID=G3AZY4_CANTC|nr:NAD(P)-binding protein [Yamadazyma tenuis ATCC 10573]XP_006685168.1 uncharacterized protein CANTEDRAFT_113009 [Yamadazyma tenuis ATCC 10573]EGV65481.1 NAD(P)-binding protein [Yamadazyma tenuis ATCC 10573]EGV65482.1 hypothetical protein CANTEDRAFT_113009 [Yamadazyma tenuis ATCC 10573]WEJ95073.1 NAD(P)-dependent dehydrogenase [Yamadazyma tenuis]
MLDLDYIESLPYVNPTVDRRTVLILGGCSGIGWYTVLYLFLHGYVVYITGRSKSRVLKCIDELEKEAIHIRRTYTSHELSSERYLGHLRYLELDPSSLTSVLHTSSAFAKLEDHLNIFINNLSTSQLPPTLTQDNFEISLQLNYIAPFLLITQLLPLLENTSLHSHLDPPKIIYTSTPLHRLQLSYWSLDTTWPTYAHTVFGWFRYCNAKVSGIHMVKMLGLRNPKILSIAVDTGFVMNPNSFSFLTRLPIIGVMFWCLFQVFGYFFGSSVEEGSYAIIKTCLDPTLDLEHDNGKYFDSRGFDSSPSRVAGDMDYAARTWIWTVNKLNERGIHIPN